jgi:hypothetical protein
MNQIIHKNKNLLFYGILFTFFIFQVRYISLGGTTYDADGLRFGSNIVLEKIQRILNFNTNFSDLPFTNVEYYGMIVILPAYIFSQTLIRLVNDPNFFGYESLDGIVYFLMNFYLIVYVCACLLLIYKKLEKNLNWETSLSFLVLLIMTPSFSGHSLFNHKDIPYMMQLFLFAVFFQEFIEKYKSRELIENTLVYKLGLLMGLILSVRINAIFFASLIIFIGYTYLIVASRVSHFEILKIFLRIYIIGFIVLYILTPSAWLEPINWLSKALSIQFDHNWSGSTLTNGEFVIAEEMNRTYLLNWFFYKLPLIFHASFLCYIYIKLKKIKLNLLTELSFTFIALTFITFSIIRPGVYDGLRQFLFLIPFFTIFATDVILTIVKLNKINSKYILFIIFLYLSFSQFGLGPYKYAYFNELTDIDEIAIECNNVDGCGNWPTDYWGYSGKEIAEFINSELLTEEFSYRSDFAWRGNSTSILFCRPNVTTYPYLDKNLNFNRLTVGDYSRSTLFVVTYHRPRYQDDSCMFSVNNVEYDCREVESFTRKIRFSVIKLASIKECKI